MLLHQDPMYQVTYNVATDGAEAELHQEVGHAVEIDNENGLVTLSRNGRGDTLIPLARVTTIKARH
jgi:hypothetical protein